MFKWIIIVVVAFFLVRFIYRLTTRQVEINNGIPIELKTCAYCGQLIRVDKAVIVKRQFFCNTDHAKKSI
jgi:hypothetical protein